MAQAFDFQSQGATAMTTNPFATPPDPHAVRNAVASALSEDRAYSDVTTQSTIPIEQQGHGHFIFKEAGVICGLGIAKETFAQLSSDLYFEALHRDGVFVEAETEIATITGPLAAMLSAERTALNFMQRMSGIATLTSQFVAEAARGGNARVVDTRKTTPGLRALERYAVRCGGGHNHRDNLQDGVLIKDNHITATSNRGMDIRSAIHSARDAVSHTLRIEVEVETSEQATAAISSGADIVLLDNMDQRTMKTIVEQAPSTIFEASGGVNLDTIQAIAATGVQLISVGALTHSAPALDVSLEIRPE